MSEPNGYKRARLAARARTLHLKADALSADLDAIGGDVLWREYARQAAALATLAAGLADGLESRPRRGAPDG